MCVLFSENVLCIVSPLFGTGLVSTSDIKGGMPKRVLQKVKRMEGHGGTTARKEKKPTGRV